MAEDIILSAKMLGELAKADFCPRCFWIERKIGKGGAPYSKPMPIYSRLDSYTKNVVKSFNEGHRRLPLWLGAFGPVAEVLQCPSHTWFKAKPAGTDVVLRGTPDAVLKSKNGISIIDYKSARNRGKEDPLYAVYEIQLNTYGFLWDHFYPNDPVKKLALVYADAKADAESAADPENCTAGRASRRTGR